MTAKMIHASRQMDKFNLQPEIEARVGSLIGSLGHYGERTNSNGGQGLLQSNIHTGN